MILKIIETESKKMRRKMREAQMDAGCGSDSDEDNNDFHPANDH